MWFLINLYFFSFCRKSPKKGRKSAATADKPQHTETTNTSSPYLPSTQNNITTTATKTTSETNHLSNGMSSPTPTNSSTPNSNPSSIGELLRICKTKLGLKSEVIYSNKPEMEIFAKNSVSSSEIKQETTPIATINQIKPVDAITNGKDETTTNNTTAMPVLAKPAKRSYTHTGKHVKTQSHEAAVELANTETNLSQALKLENKILATSAHTTFSPVEMSLNSNASRGSTSPHQNNKSTNNSSFNPTGAQTNVGMQKKMLDSRNKKYDEIKFTYEQLIREIKINTGARKIYKYKQRNSLDWDNDATWRHQANFLMLKSFIQFYSNKLDLDLFLRESKSTGRPRF